MRIALCVQAFSNATQEARTAAVLAEALVRAGAQLVVFAGAPGGSGQFSSAREEHALGQAGASLTLVHVRRADLHPEHWHKTQSIPVERVFSELLRTERIELAHVHAWQGLSTGLVLAAARAGVPAIAWLSDHFVDCLLRTRIDPRTQLTCPRQSTPAACIPCAAHQGPRTPWLPLESQWMRFEKRRASLALELQLARLRLAPTPQHAAQMEHFLALAPGALACEFFDPTAEEITPAKLAWLRDLHTRVHSLGPPDPSHLPAREWFADRLAEAEQSAWDEALVRAQSQQHLSPAPPLP